MKKPYMLQVLTQIIQFYVWGFHQSQPPGTQIKILANATNAVSADCVNQNTINYLHIEYENYKGNFNLTHNT